MEASKSTTAGLAPYLTHLENLPFVQKATVPKPRSIKDRNEKALRLVTPQGGVEAFLNWSRSHLTQQFIDYVVYMAAQLEGPYFLFAPTVGSEVAKRLDDGDVNYVDLAGNCRVRIGDEFVAIIEGRKAPQKSPRERALRAPSLQVLFTLLADPALIDEPVRSIAAATGRISPQTVTDLRKRLVAEEWVLKAGRRHTWAPQGKEQALDLLLADYDRLARHLQLGRFRTRPGDLTELEQSIALQLDKRDMIWDWGGGAALQRHNGFYRGTRTIVYVEGELQKPLSGLVPDERGEVIFARYPGPRARTRDGDLAPLLIYLDLMTEGQPRAREAADEIRSPLFEEEPA